MSIGLLVAFVAGILAFVSPCIIPMIGVYLSLITGMAFDELTGCGGPEDKRITRRTLVLNTVFFVIGLGIVFTLAGAAAGYAGRLLLSYSRYLGLLGGVFIMLLGLSLTGLFKLPFMRKLNPLRNVSLKPKKAVGYPGSFLVGAFFAVACSHCIGPMLYSMLAFAGTTGSPARGMLLLAVFSAGLAIPYLITALLLNESMGHLGRLKKYQPAISMASGVLLMGLGALVLTDKFTILATFFSRLLPYKLPLGM